MGPFDLTACLERALGRSVFVRSAIELQVRRSHTGIRAVYRVRLKDGDVVVKFRNDRPVCRESVFYRSVLKDGFQVAPRFLGAARCDGWNLLVLEYLEGARKPIPEGPEVIQEVAELMDRFHALFPAPAHPDGPATAGFEEAWDELLPDPIDASGVIDDLSRAISACEDRSVRHALEDQIPSLASAVCATPPVLDHGDVRPENVILQGRGGRFVDFENVGVRRKSVAVAMAIRNWPALAPILVGSSPPRPVIAADIWIRARALHGQAASASEWSVLRRALSHLNG